MTEEGENPFVLEDDINSKEFKDNNLTYKQKLIIGISLAAIILVLIIIIIIIVAAKSSRDDEDEIYDLKDKIGEIQCIYDYEYSSKPTKILSDKYEKKIKIQYLYRR
jgi:hypothetical protein